jgi:hypothetical protein
MVKYVSWIKSWAQLSILTQSESPAVNFLFIGTKYYYWKSLQLIKKG